MNPNDIIFRADDTTLCLQGILDTLVDVAASFPTPIVLPSRQMVGAAGAVYDCAQVSVYALRIQTGFPEAISGGVGSGSMTYVMAGNSTMWTLMAEVAIVRCSNEKYTGNTPPTPGMIAADLAEVSADAAVLLQTAAQLVRGVGVPAPHSILYSQPQGGLIASTLTLSVPFWPDQLAV